MVTCLRVLGSVARTSGPLLPELVLLHPGGGFTEAPAGRRVHQRGAEPTLPIPRLWLSACLLQLSVDFPEAVPIGQHPHPSVGHGTRLASRQ